MGGRLFKVHAFTDMMAINFNSRFKQEKNKQQKDFHLHVLCRSSCTQCKTYILLFQNEGTGKGGANKERKNTGNYLMTTILLEYRSIGLNKLYSVPSFFWHVARRNWAVSDVSR